MKEFDKNAERWFNGVILKYINSNKSVNQEIQELLTNNSTPVSQQKRLERKIGKRFIFLSYHCTNLIYILSFTFKSGKWIGKTIISY